METLKLLYPKIHFWVWFNFALYCVDTAFNYVAIKKLSVSNKKQMNKLALLLFVVYLSWGIYGMTLIYKKENKYTLKIIVSEQFNSMLTTLVWLRMIPGLIVGCLITCFTCFICCVLVSGQRETRQQTQEFLGRLPVVNNFVQQQARPYDATRD